MIKRQIESLFTVLTIESRKKELIEPKGFRLKLNKWKTSGKTTLLANLGSFTSHCNCHCKVCYLKGSPLWKSYILTEEKAMTRIKYYSPREQKGLFNETYEYGEPFLNPSLLKILRMARLKSPNEVFYPIITNGTFLNETTVRALTKLQPLILDVSLNSIIPETRKKLMGGLNHEAAINSVGLLKKYKIPYRGTIIAWPEIPLSEIEATIKYLDENDAQVIAIYPPGYTRFNKSNYTLKQMDNHWRKLMDFYHSIRKVVETPIIFSPSSYWNKDIRAVIDGVIRNSPAHRLGIKAGDIILEINDTPVYSKEVARIELIRPQNSHGFYRRKIRVLRNNKNIFTFEIEEFSQKQYDAFPYKPSGFYPDPTFPFGIFLVETLHLSYFKKIKEIIELYKPKSVVLFVSKVMKPQVDLILEHVKTNEVFGNVRVKFKLMKNLYWGGNIMLGDLMMVDDFIELIETDPEIQLNPPDLIIIPSSFLIKWGRDYTGRCFTEIERKTGIKIILLPCKTIQT
ncbi:MAG: radical SAM protein [bacterium]